MDVREVLTTKLQDLLQTDSAGIILLVMTDCVFFHRNTAFSVERVIKAMPVFMNLA